jgi:hypothetical protein
LNQLVASLAGAQSFQKRARKRYPNVAHPLALGTDPNGLLRRSQAARTTRSLNQAMMQAIARRRAMGG